MNQLENESHAPSFWRRPACMALATAALIAGFRQAPSRTNIDKE